MWNKVHIVLFKHRLEFLSEQCQWKVDILINIIYIIKHWISVSCYYEMPSKKWKLYSTRDWMLRAALKTHIQESHLGPLAFLHPSDHSWSSISQPACSNWSLWLFCLQLHTPCCKNTTLRKLKFFLSSFSSLSYEPLCVELYTMLT